MVGGTAFRVVCMGTGREVSRQPHMGLHGSSIWTTGLEEGVGIGVRLAVASTTRCLPVAIGNREWRRVRGAEAYWVLRNSHEVGDR